MNTTDFVSAFRWVQGAIVFGGSCVAAAERLAHQPRRRRDRDCLHCMIAQKIGTILPAGTASGCMRWLGGTTPEGRADLPDVMACEGAPCDDVRGRVFQALVDVSTVGCGACDTVRARSPRCRSHHDGCRMRCLGWRARALPVMTCPGRGCLLRDGGRMPDSGTLAIRSQQSRG